MNDQPFKVPFEEFVKRFRDFKTNRFPRQLGTEALAVWAENFDRGGYTDKTFVAWKPRKGEANGRHADGRQQGRALLIKSGAMRRTLRVQYAGPTMVRWTAGNQDVPYAQLHNEGGRVAATVTVKAHTRRRTEEDEVSGPSARKAKFVKITTGKSEVKAHTRKVDFTMPQRQFMGGGELLMDRVTRLFFNQLDQLWRA